jgi:hypothetical protein
MVIAASLVGGFVLGAAFVFMIGYAYNLGKTDSSGA